MAALAGYKLLGRDSEQPMSTWSEGSSEVGNDLTAAMLARVGVRIQFVASHPGERKR
jgi:hypothetical protein